MTRRRETADTIVETGEDRQSTLLDAIRRLEGNYYQAQQLIHLASDSLGEGHRMLQSWTHSGQNFGQLPQTALLPREQPRPPAIPFQLSSPQTAQYVASYSEPEDPPKVLRINCLGKFRVYQGSEPSDSWSSNRAKGILKLLVLNLGKPLSKEVFLEAFWGDQSTQSANNSFRVAIHKLRQALGFLTLGAHDKESGGPEYIISHGSNYSLNTDAPLWVDIEEFDSRWKAGRALEKAGQFNEAIARYLSAERLYEGDLLEEDIYEEWTLIKRESLVDIYLSILGKISDYYFKAADYETCIEFCQKTLSKDYCREDAYQLLIKCYIKLGLRSRALRWYRICEDTLQRELDCPVSPETASLYTILTASDRRGESPELILD